MTARLDFVASSTVETVMHWGVWLQIIAIPFWYAYDISNKYLYQLHEGFFDSEISLFSGRLKDISDGEWTFWRKFFFFYAVTCVVSSIVCNAMSKFSPIARKIALITVSFIALSMLITATGLVILLVHAFLVYIIAKTSSGIIIWAHFFTATYAVNFYPYQEYIVSPLGDNETVRSLLIVSIMMCNLRNLSFALELEKLQRPSDFSKTKPKEPMPNIIDFLSFVFYFPLFLNGPILTFDKFQTQMRTRTVRPSLVTLVIEILSCIVYFGIIEVSFHFFYTTSISQHTHILDELGCWDTLGIIWSLLQFFYVKYVVFYRFAGIFAQIDGLEPPGQPGCISNLYTFVDMWRYFDKGLYAFLQRYIYIPLGGSHYGILRQMLASFCSFAFVGFWHGGTEKYIVWALTNWAGIAVEGLASRVMKLDVSRKMLAKTSPRMYRRICAAFGSITVCLLILSNMIFLTSVAATKVFMQRLLINGWPVCPIGLFAGMYCAVNCIIDVRR